MSSSISSHFRSNVVGYVALFLVLTGVAYAAGLEPNSVRSRQIKNGQVRNADLAAGAVTASSVAPNALGGDQIDESNLAQVPSAENADHARTSDTAADADQLGGQDAAAYQQRVVGSCSGNQSVQSIAADGQVGCGAAPGSGTVTQVNTGTGLTGGPITNAGTLSLATSYRLPQSCTGNQVAKANGSGAWNCAADDDIPANPTGGDLTGTYPNPAIANGAVTGGTGGKVGDNTLTGADVNESALGQVPSALNADKVGGKTADQLRSARIHATADGAGSSLFPGLDYVLSCKTDYVEIAFFLQNPAAANLMIVASGIESSIPGGDINVANGAQTARTATIPVSGLNRFFIVAGNTSGSGQTEAQIVIDSGAKTYTVSLHLHHVVGATPSCEAFGTATVAE